MRPTNFYTVTFVNLNGETLLSRFFDTLSAARAWRRHLLAKPYVLAASIYRGGVGGMPVV